MCGIVLFGHICSNAAGWWSTSRLVEPYEIFNKACLMVGDLGNFWPFLATESSSSKLSKRAVSCDNCLIAVDIFKVLTGQVVVEQVSVETVVAGINSSNLPTSNSVKVNIADITFTIATTSFSYGANGLPPGAPPLWTTSYDLSASTTVNGTTMYT